MARDIFNGFTISIVKPSKVRKTQSKYKVSRKCLAVVVKDDTGFKARVKTSDGEETDNLLIVPFTEKSLSLKGKSCVFFKKRDKNGKRILYIRDATLAKVNPGIEEQYDVLKEGILISGYMVRIDGKLYFEYEDLIAFTEFGAHIDDVVIHNEEPLFKE